MKSMTGYSYNEITTNEYSVVVEFKSYNSRYLDLTINLPSFLGRLENRIKEKCTEKLERGKVDVFIRIKDFQDEVSVEPNLNAAKAYYDAFSKIADTLGFSQNTISLNSILAQNDILISQKEYDMELYWNRIEPVFTKALEDFLSERIREGENLKIDLLSMLKRIEKSYDIFKTWQPQMEQVFKESIQKRFAEILESNYDEQRVLQETAVLMMKYTINEEIVRLKSHIDALKKEILENPTPGKKIDFICQEMNREINTIGSKNQSIEVGQAVIEAKDALENIKEQSRNIE
ncbi:MAG: YicC family protein [Spirochaetaceae bacterium]|nr:YicC family protein [Spirochaetaceae bacterium]